MKIDSFKGDYAFLSNFYPCRILVDGYVYPSVEHAYQASKTVDPTERAHICAAKDPAEAKRRGRKVHLQPRWDEIRLQVMLTLLRQKFEDPRLRHMLAATGDAELEEGNWWGDAFWGTVRGAGENWLGQLLMHIRNEVAQGKEIPVMFLNQRERAW